MVIFPNNGKFERIVLSEGEFFLISTDDKEVVLVLLSGKIEAGIYTITRSDVFSGGSQGFVAANQGEINIVAKKDSEFCLVEVGSKSSVDLTRLNSFNCESVGRSNTSREVSRVADASVGLRNLIVGETISLAGNWSSWPPHKHDTFHSEEESSQEEVYFYKFSNQRGFGIQMLDDDVYLVRENEEFKIEKGHHPIVASPYSEMYYLWALYGDNSFFKVRYRGEG